MGRAAGPDRAFGSIDVSVCLPSATCRAAAIISSEACALRRVAEKQWEGRPPGRLPESMTQAT